MVWVSFWFVLSVSSLLFIAPDKPDKRDRPDRPAPPSLLTLYLSRLTPLPPVALVSPSASQTSIVAPHGSPLTLHERRSFEVRFTGSEALHPYRMLPFMASVGCFLVIETVSMCGLTEVSNKTETNMRLDIPRTN